MSLRLSVARVLLQLSSLITSIMGDRNDIQYCARWPTCSIYRYMTISQPPLGVGGDLKLP